MKVNNKYIGCNYNNGVYYGGILSSWNHEFKNEEVLIETGIGDIIPCMIGNITDAYDLLKEKIKNINHNDIFKIAQCIYETVDEYFNGINNIDKRLNYYKTLDNIENEKDITKVSNLKSTGAAMCVERSMLTQNLLISLGINSFYKSSGILKNGKREVHAYNLIEYNNKYYLFDTSIPSYIDNLPNPLIGEIPKEVFEKITSPEQKIGYEIKTIHYNPIRDNYVEIIYDSGRESTYYIEGKNKMQSI